LVDLVDFTTNLFPLEKVESFVTVTDFAFVGERLAWLHVDRQLKCVVFRHDENVWESTLRGQANNKRTVTEGIVVVTPSQMRRGTPLHFVRASFARMRDRHAPYMASIGEMAHCRACYEYMVTDTLIPTQKEPHSCSCGTWIDIAKVPDQEGTSKCGPLPRAPRGLSLHRAGCLSVLGHQCLNSYQCLSVLSRVWVRDW